MRRGIRAAGLAMVAVLMLAGCVGIPTSGGVVTGPVINDQLNPEFVVLPSGPRPGASEEEILADFMQAVRGPQNDYAIARQFLTTDLAGSWDPDASVLIRTTGPITQPGSTANSIAYTVSSRAYVDAAGRYKEQELASQVLEFGFTRVNGEWRISTAADGIVLSQSSFNVVFTEQALYFFDPSYGYLVPDVRWFPSRATVSVRIVRALLAGPAAWLGQGVVLSAFPTATVLGSETVQLETGSATVDLSKEALAATPQQRDRMRQELAATLGTATVVMTVGGLELKLPASPGAGAIINPTVDGAVLVGTGAAFGFDNGESITPIEGISAKIIAGGATAATLAGDAQSAAFLAADGRAYVATAGSNPSQLLDSRAGLVTPTIDQFRFVWSAQGANAATLTTFSVDGIEHPLQSGLPADARIISMKLSRDGARLLLLLATDVGPQLVVAGVIRGEGNAPTKLGSLEQLPTPTGAPIDAAWVDDRTVATLSLGGETGNVTVVELGGPSSSLGQVQGAVSLVGGNNGTDGLRVLRAGGEVWRPQASTGWVNSGIVTSFLGTRQ